MLKFVILTILFLPSILAALTQEEMASALIAANDTESLKKTFKTFEKDQYAFDLSEALVDVAKQGHQAITAACLRVVDDPCPNDKLSVSFLVHRTLYELSNSIDTESFTNVVISFKPNDAKPLATIRHRTLWRNDGMKILTNVMDTSPELITHDLPSWIAFHSLDRNSVYYRRDFEETFEYLTSFATESVLERALTILEKNEHYIAGATVLCCRFHDYFPQGLFDKINVLLKLVKVRKALIKDLPFLPTVLVDLVLDYVHLTVSDCSIITPRTVV